MKASLSPWRQLLFTLAIIAAIWSCCASLAYYTFITRRVDTVLVQAHPSISWRSTSPSFQDATIAMEDGNFFSHHGLDFAALRRALRVNLAARKIVQGGSTITQQLAKNLFLTKERTIRRKLLEVLFAIELERRLSKEQILTLYINTIDYGMGNRGIDQAAAFYFHKTPDRLTVAESSVLVGLISAPPQNWLNCDQLEEGRASALNRIGLWFPSRYDNATLVEAGNQPLDGLVYNYVSPERRGATEIIPPEFQGIGMYSFVSPTQPLPIARVAPCLKDRLGQFLRAARDRYAVTGIDHLGVFDDRLVRGETHTASAHAYGQAIDISGFRLAGGARISVSDHANPRLPLLEDLLRHYFDVVLDWQNEPIRHKDHFHAEVKGARPF